MNALRRITLAIAAGIACSLTASPLYAEGYINSDPGNSGGGVDRFVYSNAGYLEDTALGTIGYYIPNTVPWNPYDDSPAFYLGARQGGYAVDAGIDYDVIYIRPLA